MASAILHIRDSYYFEVPKFLWPSHRENISAFPEVWVRLDADYQLWEGRRLYGKLKEAAEASSLAVPSWDKVKADYLAWKSDHANFAKPLDVYFDEQAAQVAADYAKWEAEQPGKSLSDFVEAERPAAGWYARLAAEEEWAEEWAGIKEEAEDVEEYTKTHTWSSEKLQAYNSRLDGKVVIPQVFGGKLRNFYERESGVCVSKYMIVEFVVAVLIVAIFSWLGRRVATGAAPKGRLWNLLEAILVYFRDQVARPALAAHHDHDDEHGHVDEHGHAEAAHSEIEEHEHNPYADADRFLPLIWTLFVFILGCNLMGMVPWVGAPTGSFSVTTALAIVALGAGFYVGLRRFGVVGFVWNPVASMHLPLAIALVIKPMLLLIEWLGFLIRHGVLAIRLLANMVAGHLVLAAIMGLAFGTAAAAGFADQPTWIWAVTASIAVFGSAAFSLLELFVAFLQAYVFVFLTSLFLATATQKH